MSRRRIGWMDAIMIRVNGRKHLYRRLYAKYSEDHIRMMLRQAGVETLQSAEDWCAEQESLLAASEEG